MLAFALAQAATAHAQIVEDIEDEFEFEAPEVETPEIEVPEIETPEVEVPEVESPEVEAPEVEQVEVEQVETEDVDRSGVEAGDDQSEDDAAESSEGAEQEDGDSATADGSHADALAADDWLTDLVHSQNPEFDMDGNPVERGELVALDLTPEASELLLSHGFVQIQTDALASFDAQLSILAVPEGQSVQTALALARSLDPNGIYDLGHFYASPYQASTGRAAGNAPPTPVRSVAGTLRIGLIDTDIRRADLPQRMTVESRAFGQSELQGNSDHGTAVAAILAANGAGELVVANVFDNDGRRDFTSAQTISSALAWLLERHVSVVNISLAGPRNAVLDTLVQRAIARGMVIVAAAGNGGPAAPAAYPAALSNVVAVTAVDSAHRVYRYANRGAYVRLAAYGVRVMVDMGDGNAVPFTGTSFAAPRIAARIAGCLATGANASVCIQRLENSAQDLGAPGRDDVYGFGLID